MLDISQATQTDKRSILLFIFVSLWPKHLIAWLLSLSRISGLEECVWQEIFPARGQEAEETGGSQG